MKTLLKMAIWATYVVSLPVFIPFTIVVLVWICAKNKIEYGYFDVMDMIKALFSGYKEGHQLNMYRIEHCYDDDFDLMDELK